MSLSPIKRALISVSNKIGVIEFARSLTDLGVEVISTGGTAKLLIENNINVTEISDYTEYPEMMDGRVKTLHPTIHGGILGRRGTDDEVMTKHNIKPIDLVAVNLYPFEDTVKDPNCKLATAIENIDIGGPTMLRAAAKNHQHVTVIVDHLDYTPLLDELRDNQGVSSDFRFNLAAKAFEHTSGYDGAIANYLGTQISDNESNFPRTFNLHLKKSQNLRYGENPHQQAAFYVENISDTPSISNAIQTQGKPLSYNNIADTDAALECVKALSDEPSCVIVKHANPCGAATGDSILSAYNKAYQTDPTSAFGGIIAFNQPIDEATAKTIVDQQFVEVIIAPGSSSAASQVIARKKNIRLLTCKPFGDNSVATTWNYKRVTGGLLVQDTDQGFPSQNDLKTVTQRIPTPNELADMLFSWRVAKFVKSNAIVFGRNGQTLGIGAGQMSRVISSRIAAMKAADANLLTEGCSMASDAFFPFRDGIDQAAEAGVSCIIQPGGSIRDDEVIAAADEHNMAMVFTGMRHFLH